MSDNKEPSKCPVDSIWGLQWRSKLLGCLTDDLAPDPIRVEVARQLAADGYMRSEAFKKHGDIDMSVAARLEMNHYMKVAVDLTDNQFGLNNYAEPSLHLASKVRNRSKQFKSGLFMQHPVVKKFLESQASDSQILENRNDMEKLASLLKDPAKIPPPMPLNSRSKNSDDLDQLKFKFKQNSREPSPKDGAPTLSLGRVEKSQPTRPILQNRPPVSGNGFGNRAPQQPAGPRFGLPLIGPRPPVQRFPAPLQRQDSFEKSNNVLGTSNNWLGASNNSTKSNNGFGSSNNGFGSSNNGFGSSNNGFGSSNNGFGSSNNGFGSSNNGFGSSNNGFGSSKNGSGSSKNGFGKPSSGYGTNGSDSNYGQNDKKPIAGGNPGDLTPFRTAHEELVIQTNQKRPNDAAYGSNKRTLGVPRTSGLTGSFKPPIANKGQDQQFPKTETLDIDDKLKHLDPKMVEMIINEIMDNGSQIAWDDIAGLEFVKVTIKEIVVFPLLRPDIFTGLRGPPKGLLLFGPPGTGKTLIGKCIACQSKSTFFSISASSLTSKWVGEGEKMVRTLFDVAKTFQPSVVFIDEIDSILSQRSDTEHESSRRIKTEFLVQLDGATCLGDERILVVGATNRPQDLDEAARRRLVKRLYVPLPEQNAREQIIYNLLSAQSHCLTDENVTTIAARADGYSGADMSNLCKEAAMGPIRSLDYSKIDEIQSEDVRPIIFSDFMDAFKQVRASVSESDLQSYKDWDEKYGSGK